MSNARLLKIAEQLRSDALTERDLARVKIEQATGMTIQKIVKDGTTRLPFDVRLCILDNLNLFEDDDLVQFVTQQIASHNDVTWPMIVEAATNRKPDGDSIQDVWASIFGTSPFPTAPKAPTRPKPPRPRVVLKDELPEQAIGVPHVEHSGTARNGSPYVVVTFDRIGNPQGDNLTPACSFMAFGKKWSSDITAAAESKTPVSFTIEPVRNANFNPTIRKAA